MIGDDDEGMKNQLLNQIVHQYLDDPLFNQLRTIEQLGYIVGSRHVLLRDVLCYRIIVQSSEKGCTHIRNSIDACLADHREKVKVMTEEEFNKSRESVLTKLSEKDKN